MLFALYITPLQESFSHLQTGGWQLILHFASHFHLIWFQLSVRESEEEVDLASPHIEGHRMERNSLLPLLPRQA